MGIAVTKVNILNNLGTIAKCDAEAFREVLSVHANISMITQLGFSF